MGFVSVRKVLGEKYGNLFEKEGKAHEPVFCGLDEAGRGPWAGPVVACALILKKNNQKLPGIRDSKKLNKKQRDMFYEKLKENAFFGIGIADNAEIDKVGIVKATNAAYKRALNNLESKTDICNIDHFLIDGRDKFDLPVSYTSVIKGDEKIRIIAAASIIAKVERDKIMLKMAKKYPEYGFEFHKGYGTKRHQTALGHNGICKIHRKSFQPIIKHIS